MTKACDMLREKCIEGITANKERTKDMVMNSIRHRYTTQSHTGL